MAGNIQRRPDGKWRARYREQTIASTPGTSRASVTPSNGWLRRRSLLPVASGWIRPSPRSRWASGYRDGWLFRCS